MNKLIQVIFVIFTLTLSLSAFAQNTATTPNVIPCPQGSVCICNDADAALIRIDARSASCVVCPDGYINRSRVYENTDPRICFEEGNYNKRCRLQADGSCQEIRPPRNPNRTRAQPECGNGNIEDGEQCDDGNRINHDLCTNECKRAACGDGVTHRGVEECDDGNTSNSDSCNNKCQLVTCGDMVVAGGAEFCDDGNLTNGDGCSTTCRNEDPTLWLCPPGNLQVPSPTLESGESYQGGPCVRLAPESTPVVTNAQPDPDPPPSEEGPVCGDGRPEWPEECDDRNLRDGDGCSSSCLLEETDLSFIHGQFYATVMASGENGESPIMIPGGIGGSLVFELGTFDHIGFRGELYPGVLLYKNANSDRIDQVEYLYGLGEYFFYEHNFGEKYRSLRFGVEIGFKHLWFNGKLFDVQNGTTFNDKSIDTHDFNARLTFGIYDWVQFNLGVNYCPEDWRGVVERDFEVQGGFRFFFLDSRRDPPSPPEEY